MIFEEGNDRVYPALGAASPRANYRASGKTGEYTCTVLFPFTVSPNDLDGALEVFDAIRQTYNVPGRAGLPDNRPRVEMAYRNQNEFNTWDGRLRVRMNRADLRKSRAKSIAKEIIGNEYLRARGALTYLIDLAGKLSTGEETRVGIFEEHMTSDDPSKMAGVITAIGNSYVGWSDSGTRKEIDRFIKLAAQAFPGMLELEKGMAVTLETPFPGNLDPFANVVIDLYGGQPPAVNLGTLL
jgi:hypothetical protein